jgi:hypothetical protein
MTLKPSANIREMSHAERTHRNMQCIPTKRWQLPVENEQSSNPHPLESFNIRFSTSQKSYLNPASLKLRKACRFVEASKGGKERLIRFRSHEDETLPKSRDVQEY